MGYHTLGDRMGTIFVLLLLVCGVVWVVENLPWYVTAFIASFLALLYFVGQQKRKADRADRDAKNAETWRLVQIENERQKGIARAREALKNKR